MVPAGLEVIKLEYSLRLKVKCNDWLLADTCRKQPIILYFESENELKFYNLEARFSDRGNFKNAYRGKN